MHAPMDRRHFLVAAGALAAVPFALRAAEPPVRLKKALKFGMVGGGTKEKPLSILERFELAKKCGFEGMELDSPSGINTDEVVAARDKTGMIIHGVVDSIHWHTRFSDPNPEVRAKAVAGLETAIRDCKKYGGDTVLVVPGKVVADKDESYEQVWQRSQEEIRKALPLCEELKIKLAIEVVWNGFITKPEELVKYCDEFKHPLVGAYFDTSNMLKFGVPAATWIRTLGKRMFKMDFKGYSAEKKPDGKDKGWVPIGEGTEDWPEVLKACAEVGYNTWATAEVGGGGEEHLKKISAAMDKILQLA
jgi:L-ribulose-5-phosphate 3-epimerase